MNIREMTAKLDPHQRYEELCALAAAGQLNETEATELNQHLAVCQKCRESVRAFAYLCVQVLPALPAASSRLPAGMTERFMARARSEGIQIGECIKKEIVPKTIEPLQRNPWKTAFWASVAASLLIFGIVFTLMKRGNESQGLGKSRTRANSPSARASSAPPDAAARSAEPNDQALQDKLQSAETQLASASQQLKGRQRDLESAKHEKDDLTSRITQLETANRQALNTQSQQSREIAQMRQELEKARSEEAADRTAALLSESELRTLHNRFDQQTEQLDEQRRLNAAEHSARDIMVSRNLHLLDILPRDENGDPTREFGRLFYAEGKKLEFYAFDLDDPKRPNAKTAFYVWAETPSTSKSKNPQIVSLGKFSFQSAKDNRWGLIVTDPRLLARLSSIFVTVESSDHIVNVPTGKRVLSATLDRKANHP